MRFTPLAFSTSYKNISTHRTVDVLSTAKRINPTHRTISHPHQANHRLAYFSISIFALLRRSLISLRVC